MFGKPRIQSAPIDGLEETSGLTISRILKIHHFQLTTYFAKEISDFLKVPLISKLLLKIDHWLQLIEFRM